MSTLLNKILSNPHTSLAALLWLVGKFAVPIFAVWDPSHQKQWNDTAGILAAAAVAYGFVMGGDAQPKPLPPAPPVPPPPPPQPPTPAK